jgi:hypothetical protein
MKAINTLYQQIPEFFMLKDLRSVTSIQAVCVVDIHHSETFTLILSCILYCFLQLLLYFLKPLAAAV